jgi:hypothetical protein
MRRILKILLIAFGVIVIAYGIYFILGRPAVPLPAFHYTVSQGNQLYDSVKATESDKVTITLVSNGEIEAISNGRSLANITYNLQSLNNAVNLAAKYLIPAKTQNTITTISKFCPLVRILPKTIEFFFYHVIRLRLTLVITAN